MAAIGNTNEDAIQERLRDMGILRLKEEVQTLRDQEAKYSKVVDTQQFHAPEDNLDPTRTVFVLNPPREFTSAVEMEFFLDMPENKEIKKAHLAYKRKLEAATAPKAKAGKVEDAETE